MPLGVDAEEATAVLISPDPFWSHAIAWLVEAEGVRVATRASELERALGLVTSFASDLLLVHATPELDPSRLYKRLRQTRKLLPDLRTIVLCGRGEARLRDCALAGGATRVVDVERSGAILSAIRAVRATTDTFIERPLLTRRELEILRLVAEGRTNRDVAELLWVSDQTVKYHLANVYRKLGVNTRAEAVQWARLNDVAAAAIAVEDRLTPRRQLPPTIH